MKVNKHNHFSILVWAPQCTQIVSSRGSAPDPAGGGYDASPANPLTSRIFGALRALAEFPQYPHSYTCWLPSDSYASSRSAGARRGRGHSKNGGGSLVAIISLAPLTVTKIVLVPPTYIFFFIPSHTYSNWIFCNVINCALPERGKKKKIRSFFSGGWFNNFRPKAGKKSLAPTFLKKHSIPCGFSRTTALLAPEF